MNLETDFLKLGVPFLELVIRCTVIYLALLMGMRLFGKREIGQFTLFDLVFVLLVANAVQPAMTGPDSSLTGGLIIVITLLALNFTISFVRLRVPWFNRLVEPASVVVAKDGKWNTKELRRQGITGAEADAALREHGETTVKETEMVRLEADGSLSVVPKDSDDPARHHARRVRFIRHP
ncbi:MAG: YetF domain-containing protein [Candidatus Dormiibacterota bacterium]